ncbi:MAG TPA: phosphoglucomutase/phosphomannomutase family protein, partial [Firmicutes bacterium]|nr:phosphoglucomutase/phosphomannomutase family protein [Bacillota bacterium]
GGFGFGYYMPERDGIASNLMLLEFLAKEGKNIPAILKKLDEKYGSYRYDRQDVRFSAGKKQSIIKKAEAIVKSGMLAGRSISAVNRLDGIKIITAPDEWLLLRFSGTEPLLRVYAEAGTDKRVRKLLETGCAITG